MERTIKKISITTSRKPKMNKEITISFIYFSSLLSHPKTAKKPRNRMTRFLGFVFLLVFNNRLSTSRLLTRMLEQHPMSHNVMIHIDQLRVLGLQQNSHHLSMMHLIGNVRCNGR